MANRTDICWSLFGHLQKGLYCVVSFRCSCCSLFLHLIFGFFFPVLDFASLSSVFRFSSFCSLSFCLIFILASSSSVFLYSCFCFLSFCFIFFFTSSSSDSLFSGFCFLSFCLIFVLASSSMLMFSFLLFCFFLNHLSFFIFIKIFPFVCFSFLIN